MANPIREKLKAHARGYAKINAYEADLQKIYHRARFRIERELSSFLQRKGASFTGSRLVSLFDDLNEMFPEFEEEYRETYEHALEYMAHQNYAAALYDMGLKENIVGSMDRALFRNMRDDGFQHIAGATRRMKQEVVSELRRISARVMRESTLTGEPRATVSRRLVAELLYGPDSKLTKFQFIDAAGRRWQTDKYFQMLGRTLLHNNARECYLAGCAKSGSDIVTVSISGNCCKHCGKWENVLLSISGKTSGLPTLQDAMDEGLFHPNCTHRLMAVPESVAREYYDKHGKPVEDNSLNDKQNDQPIELNTQTEEIITPEQMKNILGDKVKITPLTQEEKQTVADYTGDNENINNIFYGSFQGTEAEKQEVQKKIQILNQAIDKCVLVKDITIWRGTWGESRYELIRGGLKKLNCRGMLSCSISKDIARDFARNYPNQSILYKITVPKGSHAMPVNDAAGSAYPAEREVLLKSDGYFKILKKPYSELENGEKTGRLVVEVIYHEK